MRQTFGSDVPLADQIKRITKVCTGRKHQHRPSSRQVIKRLRASHRATAGKQRKRRTLFLQKVRAYWRGERDEHP